MPNCPQCHSSMVDTFESGNPDGDWTCFTCNQDQIYTYGGHTLDHIIFTIKVVRKLTRYDIILNEIGKHA
jgi:transposase-like protein